MRVLLLAAGKGNRLMPLTQYIPKCLAPIRGRPLLDIWLENLVCGGITEIILNTSFKSDLVKNYLSISKWKKYVRVVHEKKLLGTAGTIANNYELIKDDRTLIAHADNLSIFNISEFEKNHLSRNKDTSITMMTFDTKKPEQCGIVELDQNNVVVRMHEKKEGQNGTLANAAIYIFEPSVTKWVLNNNKLNYDISTDVIPHYLGKINTYKNIIYHRDIGTIESLVEANEDYPIFDYVDLSVWRKIIPNNFNEYEKFIKLKCK